MPIGGPVSLVGGLFQGIAQSQNRARSNARWQLNEALRQVKEQRQAENEFRKNQDAIAKETLAYQKAQAEAVKARDDYDLVQARIAQIKADPGAPFKDSVLEDHLYEAHDKLDAATQMVQARQETLMKLVAAREAKVEAGIPDKMGAPGGWWGSKGHEHPTTPAERGQVIIDANEKARSDAASRGKGDLDSDPDYTRFEEDRDQEVSDLEKGQKAQRAAEGRVGGLEKARETGQAQQKSINEEKRDRDIFPLDKEARDFRTKQLEAQSAMAAAAQEIQNRQQQIQMQQQEQQQIQSLPGYQRAVQGGAATGKGGGMMGSLGMGMGMGSPGAPQSPGPGGPTVGQAIGPAAGNLMQMPLPQAVQVVRQVIGGGGLGAATGKGGGSVVPDGRGGSVPATSSRVAPDGSFLPAQGVGAQGAPPQQASMQRPSGPMAFPGGSAPMPPRRPAPPRQGPSTTNHFHYHAPAAATSRRPQPQVQVGGAQQPGQQPQSQQSQQTAQVGIGGPYSNAPMPPPRPQEAPPVRLSHSREMKSLPPGTKFIGHDGVTYMTPPG